MTDEDTISILTIIATFFPHGFTLSDVGMVKVWHRELEPYDAAEVELAVRDMCRTKDSFPTLKDIIDRLGVPKLDAGSAWAQVTAWATKAALGPEYRNGEIIPPPDLAPELVEAAKVIGDAATIAARTTVEDGVMRAHFMKAYEAQQAKQRSAEAREAIAPAPKPTPQRMLADATQAIGRRMPGGAA